MAMLVGNHVSGDSRVEKSAVSAVNAGYRVTIVGVRHRTTFQVGNYEQIPIYRVPIGFKRHVAWTQWKALKPHRAPDWSSLMGDPDDIRPAGASAREKLRDGLHRATRRPVRFLDAARDRARAALPGGWRTVWPQIADYEEAFLEALMRLEPDVVHVHDRHPMGGAAAYAALQKKAGRRVPWIYDAHEWLPGQRFGGPSTARTAWIASEAQLITKADAVLTVTERIAEQLQRRHHLDHRPGTIINAPRSIREPLSPDQRRPLREECELGPDVPLLVYVGGLAEHRGVFTMVDSLAELPGVHLAFVGSKNAAVRQQLRDRAEALGVADRMHLFDYVPSSSVTWYIESATAGISALFPLPGHDLAMPTKLREYAQAGLPAVASNVTTQAAFVREHGIGTIFEAGNPSSLADAARRLLEDYDKYRHAVRDPQFLASQTWEGNEPLLAGTWHTLCPVPAASAVVGSKVPPTKSPRRPALVLVGGETSDPIAEAWSREAGDISVCPGMRLDAESEAQDMSQALDSWLDINRRADAVLYQGLVSAHGDVAGGTLAELQSLQQRNRSVGVLSDAELADPRLLRLRPGHPMREWSDETFDRYRRQVRRRASPLLALRDGGVPLFTFSRMTASVSEGVHWVPMPVQVSQQPHEPSSWSRGPVRIVIVPTVRVEAENQAIDRLVEASATANIVVERPRFARFHAAQAARADIIVESLSLGDWSSSAVHAWANSRLVIGHTDRELMEPGLHLGPALPTPPLIEADPDSLVDTVLSLAGSLSETSADSPRTAGRDFAAAVHDGRMTIDRLRTVWEL